VGNVYFIFLMDLLSILRLALKVIFPRTLAGPAPFDFHSKRLAQESADEHQETEHGNIG
jgi:hypothetical protein